MGPWGRLSPWCDMLYPEPSASALPFPSSPVWIPGNAHFRTLAVKMSAGLLSVQRHVIWLGEPPLCKVIHHDASFEWLSDAMIILFRRQDGWVICSLSLFKLWTLKEVSEPNLTRNCRCWRTEGYVPLTYFTLTVFIMAPWIPHDPSRHTEGLKISIALAIFTRSQTV